MFGDELATIAVAILIFGRTHSPVLAAAALAASYLPWLVAAPLLAGLGDRFSRRRVLVASDLYRTAVTLCLIIPGMPSWGIITLIFLLTCGAPPFASARSALLPDVLGDRYLNGQSLLGSVSRIAEVVGLGVGGVIVGFAGSRAALLIDAATFAISALALRLILHEYNPPDFDEASRSLGRGWKLVFGNPMARWSLMAGLVMIAIVSAPLGLIVPWAAQLGHGPVLVGVLAASPAAGSVLGTLILPRVRKDRRLQALLWAAPLGAALYLPFFQLRTVAVTLVLLFVSRAVLSFQVISNQFFVMAMPPEARARAFGVAGSVIYLGQGVTVLSTGALAEVVLPSTAVGIVGTVGVILAGLLWLALPQDAVKRVAAEVAIKDSAATGR